MSENEKKEVPHVALIVQHHLGTIAQVYKVPADERWAGGSWDLVPWYTKIRNAIETGCPLQLPSEKGTIILGLSRDVSVRVIDWKDFEREQEAARTRQMINSPFVQQIADPRRGRQ